MSVGKYSPTVNMAYATDQNWYNRLQTDENWGDDEGYDKYGYHKDTLKDRAGWSEWDYLNTFEMDDIYVNHVLYTEVEDQWTFDGVRPVRRK